MENLFIARQPIYNRKMQLTGYELLYRSGDMDSAVFSDGNQASCETIINSFMHIGIDSLTGSALAYINLPEEFIINAELTPMFREQSVLEILEDVKPTAEVIAGLKRLKQDHFKIALDDFRYDESFIPFLELADFVKIDVLNRDEADIRQQLDYVRPYNIETVAEKVETQQMHHLCDSLGFDYFQGFFFCRPQLIKQKVIPANKAVVLNLLGRIESPVLDFEELESLMIQDISLSYKLLRYINSAAFSLRREIDSIKDAVILLGISNIKNWLSLILMSKVADNKPTELMVTGMVRAKMCELLAEKHNPVIKPQMFIIGLFSILDALMDTPMIDLLDTVILSTPVKMALLDQHGEHGEIFKQVMFYEQGNWDELEKTGFAVDDFSDSYIAAVEWTRQNMESLQ
ncbi:MAG: HDOD domain-containing protein [Gammaproteobacteria bacterium]|nr:HDOD domain-containing protein [Gammaproteobacteria bacterium]